MFENSAKLHNALNSFVWDLLYDKYTNELRECDELNQLDRDSLGEEFTQAYMELYESDFEKESKDEDVKGKLKEYTTKEIDRLIPKMFYMEARQGLRHKYNSLLVRRIFDIEGKDGLDETKGLIYKFEHDFTDVNKIIENTRASEKQIEFLKKLGKDSGYLLWNENYISKTYATQMIEYLSQKVHEEPSIFSFFFVPK